LVLAAGLSLFFEPDPRSLPLLDEELLDEEEAAGSFLSPELSPETLRLLPDLKSVSYHPPPFNRNPAAETFLTSAFCSQSGHVCNGSSLTF
jgi:hypothetical protein